MRRIILHVLAVSLTLVINANGQGQEIDPKSLPTNGTTFSPSILRPPNSLAELVTKSEIVAEGVVTHVQMSAKSGTADDRYPTILTTYTIRVNELAKVSRGVGQDVKVVIVGGSVRDGRLVPLEDERQFARGDRLLMFLQWWEAADAYIPVGGLRGLYDTGSGQPKAIRPFDSPLRTQIEGQGRDAVVATVRSLAAR
jgi:hypothetical protein